MMFETNVGAMRDASSIAYLRPRRRRACLSISKRDRHHPREAALRHCPDRQIVPQRDHPRNFIFRSASSNRWRWSISSTRCRLARLPRSVAEMVPGLAQVHRLPESSSRSTNTEGETRVLQPPHGRHHVQLSVWRAGVVGIAAVPIRLQQHQKFSACAVYFDEAAKARIVPMSSTGRRRRPHPAGRALRRLRRGRGAG